jgi:hypothetical protein
MNAYKLAYSGYEEYNNITLLHSEKYTDAEFETLILYVTPQVVLETLEDSGFVHNFNYTFMSKIALALVNQKGFVRLKYTAYYTQCNNDSLYNWYVENSSDRVDNPECQRMREYLAAHGLTKEWHEVESKRRMAELKAQWAQERLEREAAKETKE